MGARRVIAVSAVVLFAGALVAAWLASGEREARVTSVSSRPGGDAADARDRSRQDFALAEVAVAELRRGFPPFVFVVRVTPPSGASRMEVLEPAASGRALLPPVDAGTELAVSVVAGGSRYGFAWEETVGAGAARAPERGGRFFVVVPVTTPSQARTALRLFVADDDGWPLAGARVSDAEGTWSVTTSEAGYGNAVTEAARLHVEPPPDRPDLAAFDGSAGRWDFVAEVRLSTRSTANVTLSAAGGAPVPADLAQIELRSADGRPFVRRRTVGAGGVLSAVPYGAHDVRWLGDGMWRRAALEVGAGGARYVPSPEVARPTRVEVPGTWHAFVFSPKAGLLLMERSRTSCVLPRPIVESGGFEETGGRDYTSRCTAAAIAEDGTAVFEDVAPGDYEIVSMTEPYAVSWCVRVDGVSDVLRIECPRPMRASRIDGRVEGPSGTRCDVQMRTLGRVFDVSRPVTCPGEYEFADLPAGLYSVRAVTSDAFRSGRRDDSSGVTPWRNVVVEPGGRVTVDFRVE